MICFKYTCVPLLMAKSLVFSYLVGSFFLCVFLRIFVLSFRLLVKGKPKIEETGTTIIGLFEYFLFLELMFI